MASRLGRTSHLAALRGGDVNGFASAPAPAPAPASDNAAAGCTVDAGVARAGATAGGCWRNLLLIGSQVRQCEHTSVILSMYWRIASSFVSPCCDISFHLDHLYRSFIDFVTFQPMPGQHTLQWPTVAHLNNLRRVTSRVRQCAARAQAPMATFPPLRRCGSRVFATAAGKVCTRKR